MWKKYRATGKEMEFVGEKPSLEALQTINSDADQPFSIFKQHPAMSTLEYISLVNSSTRTILSSNIHFYGQWSKSFDVQYGEFRKSNGDSVKTPLLMKKKSYLYYHDAETMASAIEINFSHDGNLALLLILPDESISVDHYVHHLLNYESLKHIFKKLTRTDVQLTFPQFKLSANRHLAKPMQHLALDSMLVSAYRSKDKKPKHADKLTTPVDENVVLVQRMAIEIDEKGTDRSRLKSFNGMFGRDHVHFNVDRPFVFALVTTGMARQVMLLGVCEDPTKDS